LQPELQTGQKLACPHCQATLCEACPDWSVAPEEGTEREQVCLMCPSRELFVRKDFPQRLGVAIVVLGFAASSVAWFQHRVLLAYGVLFATALVDVLLYLVMGNVLECYRCHAQYRGVALQADQRPFDLSIHEKYRQQAGRLASQATVAGSHGNRSGSDPQPSA
jgi:hypothetical protein